MTKDLFEHEECQTARDEALERVGYHAGKFMAFGIVMIRGLSGEVTGEDIRIRLTAAGIKPHHHNAWGSLINEAIKLGILQPTGEYRHMRVKSSHARRTPVYTVL